MFTKPSTKRRAKEESNGDKKQRFYFKFPMHNSDFVWSQGAFSVIVKISQRFVYSSICHACGLSLALNLALHLRSAEISLEVIIIGRAGQLVPNTKKPNSSQKAENV